MIELEIILATAKVQRIKEQREHVHCWALKYIFSSTGDAAQCPQGSADQYGLIASFSSHHYLIQMFYMLYPWEILCRSLALVSPMWIKMEE